MSSRTTALVAVCVALACVAAYGPAAWTSALTNWDDEAYLDSPGAHSVNVATFTRTAMGNYHPLTMFSFAVEQQAFGRNTRVLHVTNVVLHAISAAIAVYLLALLSGSNIAAAIGGLFFAVHPLRVESVIWVAERKDVLCALFFVAALLAYSARRRTWLTLALFLLAVLSKATAISLTLALLLIDYLRGELNLRAVAQKWFHFAISVIFAAIAWVSVGAERTADLPGYAFSLAQRLTLACAELLFYLGKLIVPVGLSAYYPYPKSIGANEVVAAVSVIVIAIIVIFSMKATRVLAFSLGFFVATIAMFLPIVSSSTIVAADRYTYIPSIGIAYGIGIGGAMLVQRWRAAIALIVVAGALLFVATVRRARVWRDSVTLWTSVLEYDDTIARAWNSRGAAFGESGQDGAAWHDFTAALQIEPCYQGALGNRILVALKHGDTASAQRDRATSIECHNRDIRARRLSGAR